MGGMLVMASIALAGSAAALLAHEWLVRRDKRRHREAVRSVLGGRTGIRVPDARKGPLSGWNGIARMLHLAPKTRMDVSRDLPELMDVMRLGIEGGMSLEASFSLYADRFDTPLAQACRPAARLMSTGVEGREKVLVRLADELDDPGFRRFVGAVRRSIAYGARLAPVLEDLARDLRDAARADREEAIAKAPTKMLLPTGVFILPAMLLLIAGPFLLELLENM